MNRARSFISWSTLGLLVAVGTYFLVAEDLADVAQTKVQYVQRKALLDRLEALPDEEARIKEHLENLNSEAAGRFLYSDELRAVQARIQRDIRTVANGVGLNVGSVRSLSGLQTDDLIQRISVQLRFTTDHELLMRFLRDLEAQQPLLQVRRFSVRVQQESTVTAAAQLAVMMEISGFRRNAEFGGGN